MEKFGGRDFPPNSAGGLSAFSQQLERPHAHYKNHRIHDI